MMKVTGHSWSVSTMVPALERGPVLDTSTATIPTSMLKALNSACPKTDNWTQSELLNILNIVAS